MIDLAVTVLTTGPVVAISIVFPAESVVCIVKVEDVPTYLKFVTPGTVAVSVVPADTFDVKKPLK